MGHLLTSALAGAVSFPGAGQAGPRVSRSSLTPVNFGTAYTAAGAGGLNSGWSVSSGGAWTVPYGSVFSRLAIGFNLDIGPSGSPGTVLVEDCTVLAGASLYGISLRHAAGTAIQYCTVAGTDAAGSRVNYAIDDIYGDSDPAITACEIYWTRLAVNISSGTVTGCYIHDFGYAGGDHSDGVYMNGTYSSTSGTYGSLLISGNTILMDDPGQSAPVFPLGASAGTAQGFLRNTTISSNLLAGGGYCMYLQGGGIRADTGCAISGGTSVSDPSAIAADLGAVITGTGIPSGTAITSVTPGTGYVISAPATSGTGLTLTVRNNVNMTVTGNHFSTIYNTAGGLYATATEWDSTAGLGNTWNGNVWHDGPSAGTLVAHP